MENLGFRIFPLENRPPATVLERFKAATASLISDNMNRMHGAGADLRPCHAGGILLGPAFTVRTRSGDNLMVHKAIDMAEPGDVIVVDAGGDTTQAIVGEIMLRLARKKGVAGFVIDGAIRDSKAFLSHNYPCYARGVTHRGPFKEGPGEINVPVTVGCMVVHPGDIIFGDEDGVVAVPQTHAERLMDKVEEQLRRERETMLAIENGTADRAWVNETIRRKGCRLP
ncbi:methyltransferase [Paenibacillus cisolokensis]|uniref:Putative 4-hydroxy-4-methyl-2-oxoglutarate aldolase n=1 Tax=Paenibacillus cisolokensis TaxID=1658519 RepID=A0ABQ4NE80_9BACL|nr:RraA family protein [Paenibacillus cisolokensis]GIQ66521.1 methyltransferase [Paenibacillus cisolokensis]